MRKILDLNIFSINSSKILKDAASNEYTKSDKNIISKNANIYVEGDDLPICYSDSYFKSTIGKDMWFRRNNQKFLSLEYIYSGELMIKTNDYAFVAQAGDLVLLHRTFDNTMMFKNELDTCSKYGLIIHGVLLDELLNFLKLDNVYCVTIDDKEKFEEKFQAIINSIDDLSQIKKISLEKYAKNTGSTIELLQYISMLISHNKFSKKAITIRDYIIENHVNLRNISELCKYFGISNVALNNIFKSSFNTTPWRYLQDFRLRRAATLLQNKELNSKEIAYMVGFNSLEYFTAEFKRKYKKSPIKYRKESYEII